MTSEANFLVPDWGDVVDSGKVLLHLAGRYDKSMPESTTPPKSGTTNLATVCQSFIHNKRCEAATPLSKAVSETTNH
jgi:hypothetical protein